MKTLDLETSDTTNNLENGYALEPWRMRSGQVRITSISVYEDEHTILHREEPTPEFVLQVLTDLAGQEVWAHNAIFDIAYLIAMLQPNKYGAIPKCVRDIKWRDSMLLAKWILNGQKATAMRYSYSLVNLVSDALRDDPDVQEFIGFKKDATMDSGSKYWSVRGQLDVLWTHKLVCKIYPRLAETQRTGFLVEAKCLVPVANSWLIGLKANAGLLQKLYGDLEAEDKVLMEGLPFDKSVISSPKQLSSYLFGELGLKPSKMTPTGAASTDEESLKTQEYQLKLVNDPRATVLDKIMSVRYNNTIRSKYVKTAFEALERTGDGYMYPVPRMFGTDTGRFTYSNETKGNKVSIAAHQMPRKEKRVREAIEAPEDMYVSEWDAAGQESRIMALHSQDPVMIDIFQTGKNFHSMTGAGVVGYAYEDFEAQVQLEEPKFVEYRQMGKLTNLSCNFRISGPALSAQAFKKYDMVISIPVGNQLVSTFKNRYKGVPLYWRRSIDYSRSIGYAATASDRRFALTDWSMNWPTEQTAISLPIQGTGADHKLIAIATVYDKLPEALFMLDLHDAVFFIVKDEATHHEIGRVLNSINYQGLWSNLAVNIPLPFEGKFGTSFKDVK